MRVLSRLPLFAGFGVLLSGCANFGTNVEGSFQCRAPEGSCAASHIIDGRAAGEIRQAETPPNTIRTPRMVASGDQARTAERTLKIVFPARVDETGTLHDEAVAWTVVENPRWAAELRRKPGSEAATPLMRQQRKSKRCPPPIPMAHRTARTIPRSCLRHRPPMTFFPWPRRWPSPPRRARLMPVLMHRRPRGSTCLCPRMIEPLGLLPRRAH